VFRQQVERVSDALDTAYVEREGSSKWNLNVDRQDTSQLVFTVVEYGLSSADIVTVGVLFQEMRPP